MSKYINLIDYLDSPGMVMHEHGSTVKALHHFPSNDPDHRMLVVFEDGRAEFFNEEGSYFDSLRFILKTKPKRTITGWRRGVIYPSGGFQTQPMFCKTKEDFKKYTSGCKLFGPWESETIEIEELL